MVSFSLRAIMLQRATRHVKHHHHYKFSSSQEYTTKDESNLTLAAKLALQDAVNLAARRHEKAVTHEHLMLSIMKRDTLARKTLVKLGFRADMVQGCLDSVIKATKDPWYTKIYQVLQPFGDASVFQDWFPAFYVKEE